MGTSTPPDAASTATTDPLPPTATVTTTIEVPLTMEQRMDRVETTLRDAIMNPPKLADASVLGTRIDMVRGMADSALTQIAQLSNTLPGAIDGVSNRVIAIEQGMERLKQSGVAAAVLPATFDETHQNARVRREFKCPKCGAGSSDVVPKNAAAATEKPCGNCGYVAQMVSSVDVVVDE